jgi:2-polyprenyl-6-methoxyphenol hydroxylase-like FAD-dependent oxidoreductase
MIAETRRSGTRQSMLTAALKRAPHTHARLSGQLSILGPPEVASANTYFNGSLVQDGMIAVGDAAYAIDPLAGQGSYMSLAGALRAAEAVLAHDSLGAAALKIYEADERERFDRLLSERTAYYRLENRWSNFPFWSRRHSAEIEHELLTSSASAYG